MSLELYIIFSIVYIMTIHFAIAIDNEFNLFSFIGLFVLGGVVGYYLDSYFLGFGLSVVLTLIFW